MARFLAQRSGSDPGTVHVGFMKDEVAVEQVILTYFRFFPYLIIPPVSHIILSILQGKKMALLETARVQTHSLMALLETEHVQTHNLMALLETAYVQTHRLMALLETPHVQTQFNGPVRDSSCTDTQCNTTARIKKPYCKIQYLK
jgi:hypothetical protein